jgi:hypothetical protein
MGVSRLYGKNSVAELLVGGKHEGVNPMKLGNVFTSTMQQLLYRPALNMAVMAITCAISAGHH